MRRVGSLAGVQRSDVELKILQRRSRGRKEGTDRADCGGFDRKVFQSKTVECITWEPACTEAEPTVRRKAAKAIAAVAVVATRAPARANWSSLRLIDERSMERRIMIGPFPGWDV